MPTDRETEFLRLLNAARANPTAYGQAVGVDLTYIAPAPPLAFDARLQAVAEWRTADMDGRNWFGHNDIATGEPMAVTRAKSLGFPMGEGIGESIAAGDRPMSDQLRNLVIDAGIPSLGHRHHLLGYGWTNTHRQCGVSAYPRVTGYYSGYFCCVTGFDPTAPLPPSPPPPAGAFAGEDRGGFPPTLTPAAVTTAAPQWTWADATTDPRAVPVATRRAQCWYGDTAVVTPDPALRRVAVYCVDWDNGGRRQRVEVASAATGVVLGSREISAFVGGVTVRFEVAEPVHVRAVRLAGPNAVISAVGGW